MLLAVAGCSVFKNNEEAQAVINQRVIGMPVGDFFDRYGRAQLRDPQPDGTVEYSWISADHGQGAQLGLLRSSTTAPAR